MEKMNITHKIVAMQPELEHFAYKLTADRESAMIWYRIVC